jgi:hypothetical protein
MLDRIAIANHCEYKDLQQRIYSGLKIDISCIFYPGSCEIVELLLSKGADVDAVHFGGTALHLAARFGRDDIMKVLLDHHADVRITLAYSFSQLWSYLEWRNPQ